MRCPHCQTEDTKVIESRANHSGDTTRRRRECPKCAGRFTTYERLEVLMPAVIKKDGRSEAFDRQKLLGGLSKACQKRPITPEAIEERVARIEKQVQELGVKSIPSRVIGEIGMKELRELDPVAYVRFASVYREFRDVDEFLAEIAETQATPATTATTGDNGVQLPLDVRREGLRP